MKTADANRMTDRPPTSSFEDRDPRAEAVLPPVSIERRSKIRFPLDLRVRYRTLGRANSFTGVGWIVNISGGGALVACQHEIRADTRIELNIEWPVLLDGRVPLQLFTVGRVVRSKAFSIAVAVGTFQFRTARKPVVSIDASRKGSRKQTA
jgi:hypothetical protein